MDGEGPPVEATVAHLDAETRARLELAYGLGVYVAFVSPNVSIPDVATGVTRLRLTATDGNGRVVGEEVTP